LSALDQKELANSTLFIIDDSLRTADNCQQWRYFVLSHIFCNVQYISKKDVKTLVTPYHIESGNSYDCWKFIRYGANRDFISLADSIKKKSSRRQPQLAYVLLNQRDEGDRYLYDFDTKEPLEDFLSSRLAKADIPFMGCNFTEMSPQDQVDICGGASVFVSVHGAGNANLIFTPEDCPLIEINFRRYWFCDEVCEEHFSGELKYNENCDGRLTFRPYFHKADFHNLCYLLNKRYIEVEAEMYEGFRSRNPISRMKVFVNGNKLVSIIEREYGETLRRSGSCD
jgi:hypothetical protein